MKYAYYKTKYKRLDPRDVFVYLGNLECYCPIGQHSEIDLVCLLKECKEITKEQYLKTSGGLYTPEEYLK